MVNTVLLVEDDVALRRSITQSISLENIDVIVANSYIIAAEHIHKSFNGVVLTDICMDGNDGFDVLKYAQNCDIDLPVVMLTGHGDIKMAVRAIQEGAYDFLEKPCHPDHLLRVLKKALNQRRLTIRVRQLEIQARNYDPVEIEFPGTSAAIQLFRSDLHKFANLPINVHIWGESGSGRHSAAKCINIISNDSKILYEKYLSDCDLEAIETLENECRYSFFVFKNIELATKELQERLCDFIESNTQIRVITTSINALESIPETRLSKNLFYRVSVAQIEVPTLRSRPEDVLPTFQSVLHQQASAMQLPIPEISARELTNLTTRNWVGNTAELRQHARKVLLKLDGGGFENQRQSLASRMRDHEKSILENALKRHRGQTAQVAEELSIPVKTLYDRLSRHGLKSSRYR